VPRTLTRALGCIARDLGEVGAGHDRTRAPPAMVADERVAQNAEQPGLHVGARHELGGRRERARVRLLHEILRVRVPAGEIAGQTVERVDVREPVARQRLAAAAVSHGRTIAPRSVRPRFQC